MKFGFAKKCFVRLTIAIRFRDASLCNNTPKDLNVLETRDESLKKLKIYIYVTENMLSLN